MSTIERVALVTGAGSGIGKAVALAFASSGFQVVLAGRRERQLQDVAASCRSNQTGALAIPTDVTNPDSVLALFSDIRKNFGRLDVLFNNAGTNAPGIPIEDLSYGEWSKVIAVNLTGAFLCAQAAIRLMKDQVPQGGRIINNGSISAHAPRPHSAPYTASKHAITGLTKSISLDCRPYNIACGQIDIGNAATDMTERMTVGVQQANGTTMVEPTIDVQYVAQSVLSMANLPLEVNVQFITVMATRMPFVGRG